MSTFSQLFSDAKNTLSPIIGESASFEVRILLCHCFDISNEKLILSMNEEANEDKAALFHSMVQKRSEHIPLQYLLGKWEFMGLPFFVRENVLIPRADTETLVLFALELTKDSERFSVLDLCCGSGCIGLSIKKLSEEKGTKVDLTLADISTHALDLSKKNAESLNLNAEFIQTDIFSCITKKYDMIVCNPPYIRTADIATLDREVKNEPILALDGGIDGLDIYRTLKKDYSSFLKDGGKMLLEIGYDMAESVMTLFGGGYTIKDLSGNDRVTVVDKQ